MAASSSQRQAKNQALQGSLSQDASWPLPSPNAASRAQTPCNRLSSLRCGEGRGPCLRVFPQELSYTRIMVWMSRHTPQPLLMAWMKDMGLCFAHQSLPFPASHLQSGCHDHLHLPFLEDKLHMGKCLLNYSHLESRAGGFHLLRF